VLCLGIDPGTAVTGYGLVRQRAPGTLSLVECGVIRTRARDDLPARLAEIFDGVREVIARHTPELVAVEAAFYQPTIRPTLALGHARGVILLAARQASLPIVELAPADIKKAIVGTGAATKEQVQFMLAQLLRLREAPEPNDAADGVAAAVTCLMRAHLSRLAGAAPSVPAAASPFA
jgi:crossover junction endodeoxyribonuclease RuvC